MSEVISNYNTLVAEKEDKSNECPSQSDQTSPCFFLIYTLFVNCYLEFGRQQLLFVGYSLFLLT